MTCSTPASGTSGQADYIGGTDTVITRWGEVRSIKGKLDDQGMQQMEGRRFFQIKMRYDSGINYAAPMEPNTTPQVASSSETSSSPPPENA